MEDIKHKGARRIVDNSGPDYYPTPAWAVRALLEFETFTGTINEPCCGEGFLSNALVAGGYTVDSSDLYDYGYGTPFIDAFSLKDIENVVTNPPYNIATEMTAHFLKETNKKLALLTRVSFLESVRRYQMFQDYPPARVYLFPQRLSFCPKDAEVQGGGTVAHAWIIWDKAHRGNTELLWLNVGHKVKGLK